MCPTDGVAQRRGEERGLRRTWRQKLELGVVVQRSAAVLARNSQVIGLRWWGRLCTVHLICRHKPAASSITFTALRSAGRPGASATVDCAMEMYMGIISDAD